MKPKKIRITHLAKKHIYEVYREYKEYYDNWFDGEGSRTKTEFLSHAIGDPEDIKDYFEAKNLGETIQVKPLRLNYTYDALELTPELGKKAREIKSLEKKVQKGTQEL